MRTTPLQFFSGSLLVLFAVLPFLAFSFAHAQSAPSACASPITRDLQRGDTDAETGGDVSRLQAFLKAQGTDIYPEGLVTGTFGRLTEKAVRRFQSANGISPTGFVGPLTRAAIKKVCAGETVSKTKYSFKAKPTGGQAPLDVTFTAINAETIESFTYVVDFGDGSRGDMAEESDS